VPQLPVATTLPGDSYEDLTVATTGVPYHHRSTNFSGGVAAKELK